MRLKETDLVKLDEKTKNIFLSFKKRNLILKKNLKHFINKYKKATNFDKMCLLPQIHKRLVNVFGGPVISNFGTTTMRKFDFTSCELRVTIYCASYELVF